VLVDQTTGCWLKKPCLKLTLGAPLKGICLGFNRSGDAVGVVFGQPLFQALPAAWLGPEL
jgi:hypothetical protein